MSTTVTTIDDEEIKNHRQAIREIREKCHGFDQWGCVEALLYVVDGDRIVVRVCLWVFPNANERYLTSTSDENGGVDAYYIRVRFEGKSSFDKISLGVCRNHAGTFSEFSSTTGAPLDVDPTIGNVVRIISIEKDGYPLHSPVDAIPSLSNAHHIREVLRQQAEKWYPCSGSETLHTTFRVLRTSEYINARKKMEEDDCSSEEWVDALDVLEDASSFPWRLAEKVAEMGFVGQMEEAENKLRMEDAENKWLASKKLHICENIWLVNESLPESNEFLSTGMWGVMKSIQGTGSIPRAKLWESVILHDDLYSKFALIRMA